MLFTLPCSFNHRLLPAPPLPPLPERLLSQLRQLPARRPRPHHLRGAESGVEPARTEARLRDQAGRAAPPRRGCHHHGWDAPRADRFHRITGWDRGRSLCRGEPLGQDHRGRLSGRLLYGDPVPRLRARCGARIARGDPGGASGDEKGGVILSGSDFRQFDGGGVDR